MIDYFACARFQMALPRGVAGDPDGGVIFAAGIPSHTLSRRKIDKTCPHLKRRLFDPQLYLAGLDASICPGACTNLISYRWFSGNGNNQYESKKHTQLEWKAAIRKRIVNLWPGAIPTEPGSVDAAISDAIALQNALECEAIILPAPLTTEPTQDYGESLEWIDRGLRIARDSAPGFDRLVTIALSDSCLRGSNPKANTMLDLVVDQITAREPEGAYVVVEQASEEGYYITHSNTVGALLQLVKGLRDGGIRRIHVSLAGTTGFLTLGAGATDWSAGWYRSTRRLRLVDFEEHEGRAVPTYYSHPLAGELHLERDLDAVVASGLFSEIEDRTPAAQGLLRAVAQGKPVAAVPNWQHRIGNVTAARAHFKSAMIRETHRVRDLPDSARATHMKSWLSNAVDLAARVREIGPLNARSANRHQPAWLKAFEEFLAAT